MVPQTYHRPRLTLIFDFLIPKVHHFVPFPHRPLVPIMDGISVNLLVTGELKLLTGEPKTVASPRLLTANSL